MLLGQIYSPANPIQGGSYSTYGYKSATGVVAFSVGDQYSSPGDYVTRNAAGDMPTASIEDGVLTFSHPQTHSYVGVGDVVELSSFSVYIVGKISTREWVVRLGTGNVPSNLASETVVSINKAFSSIIAAIDGIGSGAQVAIGSDDLVTEELSVLIPCYELANPATLPVTIQGWTTSEEHNIRIFAPDDVATECNKTQRHGITPTGFTLQNQNAAAPYIIISYSDNVVIDGIYFYEDAGGVGSCSVGVQMEGSGIVSNCMFDGFATDAIKVVEAVDSVQIINNALYNGGGRGIAASASSKVIANTVDGYTAGIVFTTPGVDSYCANNVCSSNTTDYTTPPTGALFEYNCSDDATAGSSNGCVSSANTARGTTKYYDAASYDFRLTNGNDPKKIRTGKDLRAVSPYFVTHDASGLDNDDTPSMGAFHTVPSVPDAVGETTTDLSSGGNVSIVNGLAAFTVAQTNDLLSAGCELTYGAGSFTLLEKISTTSWRITGTDGLAPADMGATAITSIYPKFDGVYIAYPQYADLVSNDTKWEVVCIDETVNSSTNVNITGLTSDKTRDVHIYAPLEGEKCNSRRRHSGVWDDDLMHIDRLVVGEQGFLTVTGLQFGTDTAKDGVRVYNEYSRVEACIVKEAAIGILVRPGYNTPSEMDVLNNIVYDCDDEGIKLENTSTGCQSGFRIYNNTVVNNLYGISFDGINGGNRNIIRLINNACLDNQKDFVGDGPRSPYVSTESNWSSDLSAFSYATGRNNEIFKTIQFNGKEDFHIPLGQQLLMDGAYTASADAVCCTYIDVDSDDRPLNSGWSIGADQYSIPTTNTGVFSVGHSFGTNLQGASVAFTVEGSIATFADSLNASIGIGDKVTYGVGPSDYFFLAEKGSSTIWRVVDKLGASITSPTSGTATDIGRVANDMAAAIGSTIALELGSQDLVSLDMSLKVECYQDDTSPDTTTASISGWTTDADHTIKLEVPYDELTQCGSRQRHEGAWSTNYFHMSSSSQCVSVSDDFVSVEGLQVGSTSNNAIEFADVQGGYVERCIINEGNALINHQGGTYDLTVNSNIAYGGSVNGLVVLKGYVTNNTVIGDNGTLYNCTGSVNVQNCIAQGSATNFSTGCIKHSCISEDNTATSGPTSSSKINVVLDFSGTLDYHISRIDFEALNYGYELATNLPERDVDSELITDLSIGAHSPVVTSLDTFLSCGSKTESFTSPGLTVSISGVVATFSSDIDDANIVAGDVLTYDVDSKTVYLHAKIDDRSWEVYDKYGQAPTAASSKVVVSLKRPFNAIENLFDTTHASSIAQFFGDATNPFTALDKAKLNIYISVASDGTNVEPVNVVGYTADSTNHFTLFAPVEGVRAMKRHKHEKVFSTTEYSRLVRNPASTSTQNEMIYLQTAYTKIDGLIIQSNDGTSSGKDGIAINASGCKVVNNIIAWCANGVDSTPALLSSVFANNIIFNCWYAGISCSLNDRVYNNTVSNVASVGASGILDTAGCYVTNNIVQDCGSGVCYAGFATYFNNMADDVSLPVGSGNLLSTSAVFVDTSTYDFGLQKASSARGAGKQLGADIGYAFSVDIAEEDRGRFWDMGAIEYEATKTVYYSFGSSSNHRTAPADGVLTMEVSNAGGKSYAIFDEAQTSSLIMSGDIVQTGTQTFYLAEKITTSKWRITNADGSNVTNNDYNIVSIGRAISAISSMQSRIYTHLGNTLDLVTEEVQVNVVVSSDVFSYNLAGGSLTFPNSDSDYFFKIFAPIDTEKYCNVSQRHTGSFGDGAHLQVNDGSTPALEITDTAFFQLEGVVITNLNKNGFGVKLTNCSQFVVDSNIIRNCALGGLQCETNLGMTSGANNGILNNIVSGCGFDGISIEGSYANYVWLMNNTVVDCASGFHHIKGIGSTVVAYLYNNVFRNDNGGDIVEDNPNNSGKLIKQYNISKDDSASDINHNINHFDVTFVDAAAENYELDPDTDSFAIDSAIDMQILSPFYYDDDIRGIERETLFWDRGALERNENIGSGTMVLGPLQMKNSIGIVTDERPTSILYLRTSGNEYPSIPAYVQFNSITVMNVYLAINTIDNIIVYVEGGESFQGEIDFADRGIATAHVQTDPGEIKVKGTASIVYDSGLVSPTSINGGVTFENLNVYSADSSTDYTLGGAATTTELSFLNCILQVNNEAICNNSSCTLSVVNSTILYFNKGGLATLYLNASTITGHTLINSIVLCESADAEVFSICAGVLTDWVSNVISYNHGAGSFDIDAPGRTISCQEDVDPLLTEMELNWIASGVSVIMAQSDFTPLFESTVVDNGNDSVVTTYDLDTDIVGNNRIFEFGKIDIGPYELEVHILDIVGSDIQSIDQVKCEIDRIKNRVVSLNEDLVYTSLFNRFKNDQATLEEFIREENITIALKSDESTISLKTDKPNELLATFDANYDAPTRTILVKKIGGELSRKIGQMLESDLYVLHFDEQESKLYLYLNKMATLGLSGTRNPVNNVKFGGNPTFG